PFLANVTLLSGMIDRYSWQLAGTSAYAAELLDDLHPEECPVFVEPLTSRERAVLEYLPTMMTNTEIARQLLVSVNTVKTHLKAVYRKLGVARRREAVLRAKQLEILGAAAGGARQIDALMSSTRRTSTSSRPSASMRRRSPWSAASSSAPSTTVSTGAVAVFSCCCSNSAARGRVSRPRRRIS